MLKVGITGGIGSGKSMVCQVFETLGIPVFNADLAAKYLIDKDERLVAEIKKLFGDNIYTTEGLDRKRLSSIVFNDKALLERLNAIVHPATIQYGRDWMDRQLAPYVIKEAAIFFESGSNKDMDVMIGVYAPKAVRLKRVVERDQVLPESVLARMEKQIDDEKKMKLCDYVVTNDDVTPIIPQVIKLHHLLIKKDASAASFI
mgnify:CR=1 FL=1